MNELLEIFHHFFSDWNNLYIAIAIIILMIIGLYYLILIIKKIELKKNLNKINYFNLVTEKLLALFGTSEFNNVLNKSSQLVKNFSDSKTLDYLIKYFGFQINDETIYNLNGLLDIVKQAERIEKSNIIYKGVLDYYLPKFTMKYSSPKGRSTSSTTVTLNSKWILWLRSNVKNILRTQNNKQIERKKMTNELREAILRRDNWTCQCCGNSRFKEPNLALEVDHIIPVAKGGKTEPNNLQTLCWRCNRRKSDNIVVNKAPKKVYIKEED